MEEHVACRSACDFGRGTEIKFLTLQIARGYLSPPASGQLDRQTEPNFGKLIDDVQGLPLVAELWPPKA